jgi:hypothetical protein
LEGNVISCTEANIPPGTCVGVYIGVRAETSSGRGSFFGVKEPTARNHVIADDSNTLSSDLCSLTYFSLVVCSTFQPEHGAPFWTLSLPKTEMLMIMSEGFQLKVSTMAG